MAALTQPTMTVPADLAYVANLHFHRVTFDPTRGAHGLVFDNANTLVTQNTQAAPQPIQPGSRLRRPATETHKIVLGTEGWSSDSHYFSLKVVDAGPNKFLMIGVCDASFPGMFTASHYPGLSNDGVSYYGANGYAYRLGSNVAFGRVYGTGDEVGVLLNMTHRTCSFYLNGTRVGTAAGADVITSQTYFPAVALYELGSTVVSLPPP
ncbi:hypothetical protein Pelo_13415 [Pelomyxa schiedti]|nr:hypothetical protein Pelo_13415 [Pelomyxa schiedti]